MKLSFLCSAAIGFVVVAVAACSVGAPSASPSAAAASYADFDSAFCGAFTSLIRAVGNPDAGTPSVMSTALDYALAAGDAAATDRAASAMLAELETGRQQAALAARWQPAAATMVQMDRVLVAFEALTAAKRAAAAHDPGAVDPQKAFEQAGGAQAWSALLTGVSTIPVPAGASPQPCRAMSGQL
jgi:hypothetical protein